MVEETLYEAWAAGGSYFYLYTEHATIARFLRKRFGKCSAYQQFGRTVGWQFRFPKRMAQFIELSIRRQLDTAHTIHDYSG